MSCKLNFAQEQHRQYYLGDIKIGPTSNVVPANIISGQIQFGFKSPGGFVILRLDDEDVLVYTELDLFLIRDLVKMKHISLEIFAQEEYVYFKVFLTSIPLLGSSRKITSSIQTVFRMIGIADRTEIKPEVERTFTNNELNYVYEKLMEKTDWKQCNRIEMLHLEFLKPNLRPYQERAVQWMLYRETKGSDQKTDLHPSYEKVTIKSGLVVYFDKHTGWLETDPPLVSRVWKGGILADEMGLGKTVEVLALILSHQKIPNSVCKVSDDNTKQLTIITSPRKRQLQEHEASKGHIDKRKMKREEVAASKSNKSATFQALQTMYSRTLLEFCTTKPRESQVIYPVQCICGSTSTNGAVKCDSCAKLQHTSCLAWRDTLGPYKCPQCWENADLIESKATLIVVPQALKSQWCREIETHLRDGLKILVYDGLPNSPVYPTELLEFDIVITTYTVLRNEIKLNETDTSINRRRQRKYWPALSPLLRVLWWRICLDEAQTVEMPNSLISKMTKKITACHKWAVTGTPMSKGVTDIFGLIDYLQMEPYNDSDTWKHVLYNPYVAGNPEPMFEFLSKVLWRTSKNSILHQINIPHQTQELHMLEFSAVEKFFYNREHEMCSRKFLQIAAKFDQGLPLQKMHRKELKKLMAPLLYLREACSDASTVRGKGRYLSLKKDAYSMKDLLEALIMKNKNDCEEALRLMVSSINGLAGIYVLLDDMEQAVREYRKVLQLAAKFSAEGKDGRFDVDKLPLIHAMYNLAEILETYQPQEYTLRDSSLMKDCIELEKQYIEKSMKETGFRSELYNAATDVVTKHQSDFGLNHGQWYSDGFDWVTLNGLDEDLISRIHAAAANVNSNWNMEFRQIRSLLRKIYNWHVNLEQTRDELRSTIDALYQIDTETNQLITTKHVVEKAMECHLRPVRGKAKTRKAKCPICVANGKLKAYEEHLYNTEGRAEMCEKKKLEELVLKCLLALLKSNSCETDIIKDGETHLLLIEAFKKEFKEISKLWTLLDRQVCAQDEVEICKMRLQLKTNTQKETKINHQLKMLSYEQSISHENIHLISPEEVPYQELTLRSEESKHNMRLESLLGTRNYLGTLRQQQFEGYSPDPCPVCQGPLVKTWAILSCAHTYCLECSEALINPVSKQIQCCVCRSKQNSQDVAYINTGSDSANEDETDGTKISVIGNYCRKIESVVQLVLNLRKTDSKVQVLIFSTWLSVLKLLSKALNQNNVRIELASSGSAFAKRIEQFKDPLKNITALLLPVDLGAKGLNLTEATHVILLEPLLNTADELQAIGRVHRIGQTRKTVVHKFLIRDTIEEALYNATSSNAMGWEKGKVTIGQLRSLFKNAVEENQDVSQSNPLGISEVE